MNENLFGFGVDTSTDLSASGVRVSAVDSGGQKSLLGVVDGWVSQGLDFMLAQERAKTVGAGTIPASTSGRQVDLATGRVVGNNTVMLVAVAALAVVAVVLFVKKG